MSVRSSRFVDEGEEHPTENDGEPDKRVAGGLQGCRAVGAAHVRQDTLTGQRDRAGALYAPGGAHQVQRGIIRILGGYSAFTWEL